MGHIKQLLALENIEPRHITATSIWTDLCEDIHLHYRNLRLDFSQKEWAHFRAAINHLGMATEFQTERYQYEEGDPNFLVSMHFNTPLHSNSEYYPNRLSIELQRDDTVHVHYRDLRMHYTVTEFKAIARAFVRALQQFESPTPWPYPDITEPTRLMVDINAVTPWDAGHLPGAIDAEHRAGIEYAKRLIKDGKNLRPILVDTSGQRKDGFKRYMAQLEMDIDVIECIVDPNARMGGQNNQSMIDDEG